MEILFARNVDFDVAEANKVQVVKMCRAFQKNGCNVTLLTFGKKIEEIGKNHKINSCFETIFIRKKIRFFVLGDITLFLVFLRKKRGIQNIFTRDIIFALLVKLFFKDKKVVLEMHDVPQRWWWKFIYRKFSSKVDRLILISQGLKEGLIELGLNKNNMTVLQDGVSLSEFDIPFSKTAARKEFDLPQDKIIILYLGSTGENRDIPAFIEAAKKRPGVCFVIFGKEQKYIREAASKIPNLIIRGYTSEAGLAYRAADILFAGYTPRVSTIKYMSPLKIFEYMAAKRPTITADFPRTREILDEDETYFYESQNSLDIVQKIDEIMNNKDKARARTMMAFDKARKYTWEKRCEEIISFMKEE